MAPFPPTTGDTPGGVTRLNTGGSQLMFGVLDEREKFTSSPHFGMN